MTLTLRLRSAVLLAASAAAGPAFAQALPPGYMPGPGMPMEVMSGPGMPVDSFSGGAYATPTGAPIMAYGDTSSGTVISGPTSSGPVYMAPQVIGGGGGMPGSPGCNCGPGGAPMMDPSLGGTMMAPSYGMPMADPSFGGMPMGSPMYGGMSDGCSTGCCLTDSCLGDLFCSPGASACDPCGTVCPPICDPCQQSPVYAPGGGGIYHGASGAQRCGWAAGFTWVFLKPNYGANDAFFIETPTATGTSTSNQELDYSLNLSPRVFVEWVSRDDNGIRATWMGFENDSDAATATAPAGGTIIRPIGSPSFGGDVVRASSGIDLNVIDLDLTQRLRVRNSLLNIGGGLRWAGYEHDYNSTVTSAAVISEIGSAARQFDGFGPTVFAEWRRPIGSTRFSILASVRGSMLYGESQSTSVQSGPFGTITTSNENDDFVAVGESQLGGEWSAWLSQRTVLFVQVAAETQYWLGVGTAFDRNDDLGLFGFNTTVGLEW